MPNEKDSTNTSTNKREVNPESDIRKYSFEKDLLRIKFQNAHARSLWDQDYLRQIYESGKVIEAFSLLYADLEQFLLSLWAKILIKYRNFENSITSIEYDFKHEWEFPHIIRVLNELQVLSDHEYQYFKNFRAGRNDVVHTLPSIHNSKIKKKTLDFQFEQGLKALEILSKKNHDTKSPLEKKILENFRNLLVEGEKKKRLEEIKNPSLINTNENPLNKLVDIER